MKNAFVDTNIYVSFKRGDPDIIRTLQSLEKIYVNAVVFSELLVGFKDGRREETNREELKEFINNPRVTLVSIDDGTAEFYAHIFLLLKIKGRPIPTNDIWIAASTMQYGLGLYTRDQHFRAIEGLLLI